MTRNESAAASEAKSTSPLVSPVPTTASHRCCTLVGITFVLFECIFLSLYSSDYWFGCNVSWLGIPAIFLAATVSHFMLRWLESPSGCRFMAPISKGKPATVYWQLLLPGDSGFIFGTKHVLWDSVDELKLTIFGNLLVLSRAVCGQEAPSADLVLKLPIGTVATHLQSGLVSAVAARKPQLVTNPRLEKRLAAPALKGAALVQSLGAIFMSLILLDLGHSTFRFLEMNKQYYLSQIAAKDGQLGKSRQHLDRADRIAHHPLPFSWVTSKLLGAGAVAAGVHQLRSEALVRLGLYGEATAEAREAVKLSPDSFRFNLRLSRLLAFQNTMPESRALIRAAIKNHKDSLLPRLYMLAELADQPNSAELSRFYQIYLDELSDKVFGVEPAWPPGGNRFLHEIFYSDDVTFIFNRFFHLKGSVADDAGAPEKSHI